MRTLERRRGAPAAASALPGAVPRSLAAPAQLPAAAVAVVFCAGALFAASVVPYRQWDALAFGTWSRLIGETGDLFPDGVTTTALARPLFYVEQGLAWHWLGYHAWLGRWLSAAFGIAFVAAVALLAGQLAGAPARSFVRPIAVAAAVASSVVATFFLAGMTDVPVAAAAAVTAVALWSRLRPSVRVPLVAGCAAATVLAKPSGLVALAGIALATATAPAPARRPRLVPGLAALASGAGAGLVYDAVQARRSHVSLRAFLESGNTDYYLAKASSARLDQLARAAWLGEAPRLLVVFGVVYALARVSRAGERFALAVAGVLAVAWSLAGPALVDGATPYPFRSGPSVGLVAWTVLVLCMAAAPFGAPTASPLDRRALAMLLVWLAPGLVAWIAYRSDDVRFLSPAWAPLVLLAGCGGAALALSLLRVRRWAALAPPVAAALLGVPNLASLDGLGHAEWRHLLELGPSGWGNRAAIENFAYGPFSYELDLARQNLGPGQRIVTSDGRLSFFFPRAVDVQYARSCADLRGARLFVLLTGDESVDIMERLNGSAADPLAWAQCGQPRLRLIGSQPGIYSVFVNGRPARAPSPADCHVSPSPGSLLDGVFADAIPYAAARALRARAASVGFVTARIEQTGCDSFRVVVPGIPEPAANQADFRREAVSTGFRVRIVPAQRFPEVPPDVPPARARA